MKLSIIVPVFNELRTIREILARIESVPLDKEIIVVDDGSKDGTREALRDGELGILVDPADQESIKNGIVAALARPRGVPPGLEYFSFDKFCERLHSALASAWNR